MPLGPQEVEAPTISRQSAHEGGKVVSPKHQPTKATCTLGRYLWYSFLLDAESNLGPWGGRKD